MCHPSPASPSSLISGLALISFDANVGPVLLSLIPSTLLTTTQTSSLLYLALPPTSAHPPCNLTSFHVVRLSNLFAHVCFLRQIVPSAPRGCLQHALIILTPNPSLSLPYLLLRHLAPSAIPHTPHFLDKVWTRITHWPLLTSSRVNLPLQNVTIHLHLPSHLVSSTPPPPPLPPNALILPLCAPPRPPLLPWHDLDSWAALRGVHSRLHAAWELLATGERLVVTGPSASRVSAAVLALVRGLYPLRVGGWEPWLVGGDQGALVGVANKGLGGKGVVMDVGDRGGMKTSKRARLRKVGRSGWEGLTRKVLRVFDWYLTPTWGDGKEVTREPYASEPFGRVLELRTVDWEGFPRRHEWKRVGDGVFRGGEGGGREFYGRFVKGAVFKEWWQRVKEEAEAECREMHRRDVLEACVRGIVDFGGKREKREKLCERVLKEREMAIGMGDEELVEKLDMFLDKLRGKS